MGISLNKTDISKRLAIQDPFLFIDQIDHLVPGKSSVGHKKLESSEWFFQCHLPAVQAMPGTLLVEAMLQTLVLTIYSMPGHEGKPSFVTEMQIKLFSKVTPVGDLRIAATLNSYNRGVARGEAVVTQGDTKVCSGEFVYVSPHDVLRPRGG